MYPYFTIGQLQPSVRRFPAGAPLLVDPVSRETYFANLLNTNLDLLIRGVYNSKWGLMLLGEYIYAHYLRIIPPPPPSPIVGQIEPFRRGPFIGPDLVPIFVSIYKDKLEIIRQRFNQLPDVPGERYD